MKRSGLVAAFVLLLSLVVSAPAAQSADNSWFTSWAQSQHEPAETTLRDQSVRMVTHLSQGGDALRVRIQNQYSAEPLTIGSTTAGFTGQDADVTGVRPLTFDGKRSVTIPPGGDVWSDSTPMRTRPDTDVSISMHVRGEIVPGQHGDAFRKNYLTAADAGDHTGDVSGAAYTETVESTYLVSAVDVHNSSLRGTVVGYGSSVVDGVGSTNCGPGCTELGTNQRWTDDLARRIVAEKPATGQLAVANAGVSGTTSSAECSDIPDEVVGRDALARLERDVLALHGVTGVIYYYGTNDLAFGCDAEQILRSYREVFQRLHDAGIDVYVTPITPRASYTDQNNLDRHAVGTFTQRGNNCSGTCDGVIDFDRVLRDPLQPNRIYPPYDHGDGVHANARGQQALADFVPLSMLAAR